MNRRSIYNTPRKTKDDTATPTTGTSKKTTKKAPNPIGKFIIHSNHKTIVGSLDPNAKYYQVISIDLGVKNYAFRIERRYNSMCDKYHISVNTIAMQKVAFEETRTPNSELGVTSKLCRQIIDFLDSYHTHYNECCLSIIERQHTDNMTMTRASQVTIDYFLMNYPKMIVIEMNAHVKTEALGAPKGNDIKKWSIDKATQLLIQRGDDEGFKIVNSYKKKDDVCDTIIGIEALFTHLGLQTTDPRDTFNPVIVNG